VRVLRPCARRALFSLFFAVGCGMSKERRKPEEERERKPRGRRQILKMEEREDGEAEATGRAREMGHVSFHTVSHPLVRVARSILMACRTRTATGNQAHYTFLANGSFVCDGSETAVRHCGRVVWM
jgi:hypothetical protein